MKSCGFEDERLWDMTLCAAGNTSWERVGSTRQPLQPPQHEFTGGWDRSTWVKRPHYNILNFERILVFKFLSMQFIILHITCFFLSTNLFCLMVQLVCFISFNCNLNLNDPHHSVHLYLVLTAVSVSPWTAAV